MCLDPITMMAGLKTMATSIGASLGGIGTALTIGSTAIGAYSQIQSSKTTEAVANANAAAQDAAARDAIEQGKDQSDKHRRAAAAGRSQNIAAAAANGVDVTGLGASEMFDDSLDMGEEDAFAIRENSVRAAEGHSQSAANYRAQASQAGRDAFYKPLSTLIKGASKVGNKYAHMVGDY